MAKLSIVKLEKGEYDIPTCLNIQSDEIDIQQFESKWLKMKNLEINKNAVKKLSMAAVLAGSLLLGGCGSDKTNENKPSGDKIVEEKPVKEARKLSVEETKKLTEGQTIEWKDGQEPVIPDEETLESMGLDYAYIIGRSLSVNGGEFAPYPENQIWYHDDEGREFRTDTTENGNRYINVYTKIAVEIIPIVFVEKSDGKLLKTVEASDGGIAIIELVNPENFDKIMEILIQATASNYTKSKKLI